MAREQYDAIIIGAGHNGLVCAFYLARSGRKALILERADKIGGAAITEEFYKDEIGAFRNSVASYTVSLLQPKIIKDMQLESNGLKVVLRKVDNFLPTDNGYLLAGRGGLTVREIARYSKKDAAAYGRYEQDLNAVVALLKTFILESPPNTGGGLMDVLKLLKQGRRVSKVGINTQRQLLGFFTKSAAEILDQYFEHDLVKALFGFDAVVGHFASPYEPGSAYVLLHHVFGEAAGIAGAWGHAVGGMGAITQAMGRACEKMGVEIKTNRPVTGIDIHHNRVKGVKTDGAYTRAKTVISNTHPKILFEHLIPDRALTANFKHAVQGYKSHSGTFRMNVALDRLPKFTHCPPGDDYLTAGIIIAPSLEYMDKAWLSARQYGWSKAPIIEMLIPSTLDDSLAPEGKHVASLFCQQFAYDLPAGKTWDSEREKAADHILKTVDHYAPGFAASVMGRQILSPLDLERKFALVGGDIFHGRMSLDQMFSARPVLGHGNYKTPIQGLYMCGSGTHPGGGVTGAPGHNAAHIILGDTSCFFS